MRCVKKENELLKDETIREIIIFFKFVPNEFCNIWRLWRSG
jgi:hypothetical protein